MQTNIHPKLHTEKSTFIEEVAFDYECDSKVMADEDVKMSTVIEENLDHGTSGTEFECQSEVNNNEDKAEAVEDYLPSVIKMYQNIFGGNSIPFFQNGCLAKKENIFSKGTNYTCAIDSFLSLCEALLLCGNEQTICHSLNFGPILQEVRRVLIWRLQNNYQWNHVH